MKLFEEISEHGIFHGITNWQENMPLNIKDKKWLIYNRVGEINKSINQWGQTRLI